MTEGANRTARIDHVLLGVPDLDVAVRDFEIDTGVRPMIGGEHPDFGTCNALVRLCDGAYFEIIGPGPEASAENLGGVFARLESRSLAGFALASGDLEAVAERVRQNGFEAQGPIPGSRTTPDGDHLEWQMLMIGGHEFGGFVPFLIDWGDTPHPAATAPPGLSVARFEVRHPNSGELRQIYRDLLGVDLTTVQADHSMLDLVMDTPRGRVAFRGDGPLDLLDDL
jgi:catechol 2,3-dioxygenase-like lactoylglutathione lyase family enzyme